MSSMDTRTYMIKNNMSGTSNNNGRTTVKGFVATKQYSTTRMEQNESPPSGAAAAPQSNSDRTVSHEIPPPATTVGVVGEKVE